MRPCPDNRKRLAWLVVDVLEADQAVALRAHLDDCPGCRAYLRELEGVYREHVEAAATLPRVEPSESFHRRLVGRIHEDERRSVRVADGEWLRRWWLNWRMAIPALIGAFVAVAIWLWPGANQDVSRVVIASPQKSISPVVVTIAGPTLSAYRTAANTSFETLDELLSQQAARAAAPAEAFTVSSIRKLDLWD